MTLSLPVSVVVGLFLQAPVVSAPLADAPVSPEAQRIRDSAYKWRFTMPYYDQKKQSFVCRTAVTSGDKRSDRAFCQAMVTCYNRYRTEHHRMMRATGDAAEIHEAARDFRQKRNICFRSEVAPLVHQLATRHTSKTQPNRN